MPLRALPLMLEGYAERGGVVDDAFFARALCQGIDLSL